MSSYRPRTNTASSENTAQQKQSTSKPTLGIYIGEVTSTIDFSRTGKIQVFISALSKDKDQNSGLYDCTWTSPFAGGTDVKAIGKNVKSYSDTQKSYGFWMVPPDNGNLVLVAFGDGNTKFPFCIGCLFPDKFNHMVPGMAYGRSYGDPSMLAPVAEKNKYDQNTNHNDVVRPIHAEMAEAITVQGLINDSIRGAGSSSARRESPSEVFGILTPGPRDPDGVGWDHRLGGHQFVMDDNLNSRNIRLRTAGGSQLLLDDTTGSIYMINRGGKGWFEIDALGNINIFGEGSLNIRSKGNLNLRADKNINIEAGNDLNLKAAGDNVGPDYLGTNPFNTFGGGPLGTGGAIRLDAAGDIQQFAALNYGVTAAGGDIDISAGGRVAITPSGPLGFQLLAPFGPIALQTTIGGISMSAGAGGVGVTSAAPIGLVAPQILLNSGPGFFFQPMPAIGPAPIGLNEFEDQPAEAPEFDKEAAYKGERAIKNNGKRKGRKPKIKTIVTCLVTAEPYEGHVQTPPGKEDPNAKGYDESITKDLPPGASTTDGKPDDVQTPTGSKAGTGYTDSNGNKVTDLSKHVASSTSTAKTGTGGANNPISNASGAVNRARATATSGVNQANKTITKATSEVNKGVNTLNQGIRDLNAMYSDVANAVNNFKAAAEKKIKEVLGLNKLVDSIKAAIPPIRFPTVNAIQQKIIGSLKQLRELEAQLKAFSLDSLGLPNLDVLDKMMSDINGIVAKAKDSLDAIEKLKEAGYSVIRDTTGSLIYVDKNGNTMVDFSQGLGDIGNSLAIAGDINQTFNQVKSRINVPLSDNQTLAISEFARDIGVENFLNSNVLAALNEGKYSEIPRLMKTWSLGPELGAEGPSKNLVFRQDFEDKRMYSGQVFQSPDNLDLSPPAGTQPGDLNFAQLASLIRSRREAFIANNTQPTRFYSGPNG